MSKQIKFIATAVLVLSLMLCLSACSDNWEAPYASLQDSGYSVSVRFDVNGGFFAGATDVAVVDVFSLENGVPNSDGTVGFWILRPEDTVREQGAFEATKNGYFLAGWYQQRTPRVDAQGQPLDEYGVPCAESGREQGYTYSGKWDFDTMTLNVDPEKIPDAGTPVMTLYAAWIPYINYEFYCVDSATGETSHLATLQSVDLEIPEWNQKNGKLNMKDFPLVEGMTFDAAYLSADLSQPLTETIHGQDGYVNYDTGTLSAESVAIYTTWLEGSWFKVFTADQLSSNARPDGNYILMDHLDFSDAIWPASFIKNTFTGTIVGNGFTVTGISAIQADNSRLSGGLFGSIGEGAQIRDLTFENVTFTVEAGCRLAGSTFGLLTGSVVDGAVFENVSVSGNLLISENIYPQSDYTIGLLCGSGNADGVTYDIGCSVAGEGSQVIAVTVNEDASVTVTFLNP